MEDVEYDDVGEQEIIIDSMRKDAETLYQIMGSEAITSILMKVLPVVMQ